MIDHQNLYYTYFNFDRTAILETLNLSMERLHRIAKSGFLRNVATVSGGHLVAAAVPFLAAPILGRLYAPEDYGALGSIMSLVAVLGSIATWQYSQAIVIVKRESEGHGVVQLCIIAALITALLSVPFSLWLVASTHSVSSAWFFLLPLSVLCAGISACFTSLVTRWQFYRRNALVQWIPILFSVIMAVLLGSNGFRASGLLWSYFASQVLALALGWWVVSPRLKNPFHHWSWRRLRIIAHRHRRFPIYTMPTGFISSATLNAPIFALTVIHSHSGIGLFNRANQLLGMPLGLIGGAVAQVFQRRAAQDIHASGNCRQLFKKTLLMLFGVGVIPTLLLTVAAPSLFGWFLGPKWVDAGAIAQWLAPMLLLRVVSGPLSTLFYVRSAQRLDFMLTLIGSFVTCVAIIFAIIISGRIWAVICAYSFCYCLMYLAFLIAAWRLTQKAHKLDTI